MRELAHLGLLGLAIVLTTDMRPTIASTLGLSGFALGLATMSFALAIVAVPLLALRNAQRREVRKAIRKRLVEAGIAVCLSCGYDLRGQTAPRCPECGTPFDQSLLCPIDEAPSPGDTPPPASREA